MLPPPAGSVSFDFDGDGKADLARFRSSANQWEIKNSLNGTNINYTLAGQIVPADYDGDSITDIASFVDGNWTIKKSSNGQTQTTTWGTSGDKPVVGDYDGDGKADLSIFRPSTNTWWILQSSNGLYTSTSFGTAGDITVQGNYDGDSKTDIAVYRPSTGDWHISASSSGYYTFQWGVATDIPVPADYHGAGQTDPAVYRGSTGTWYAYKSSTNDGAYFLQVWGNYGDQPVPADYDGDGKTDFSIWRPTTGVWHTIKSANQNYDYQTLGMAGDTAVPSAYLKQIGGQVLSYDLSKARLSPKNETGGTDLYSQNFGWGSGLAGLSGRAGLSAGFGISYNSLVWTKDSGSGAIYFDADVSNVSPGFRFGFPVIEPVYWDRDTENFSYLMIAPSGARVEFKQIGASGIYETADSSYVQLKTVGASSPNDPVGNITIILSGTDGTKMTYLWKAGAFRCSEIKDRNGNFITIYTDDQGLLRTVTDTLGRVLTVNYDAELYPTSIVQDWKDNNGQGSTVEHTWATFTYTGITINTAFASGTTVFGPPNGTSLKVLDKLTYPNGSSTQFEYNGYGQVWKVKNIAADSSSHILNYVSTNLQTPSANQTDCPRFTETRNWIENFNNNQETVITNSLTPNQTYNLPDGHSGTATKIEVTMVNHPHGAISKTFVGESGWMESLPIATEDWANGTSGSERKRWTWTGWTQDNTSLSYIQNPRVIESKVGDTTNIKRSTLEYLMQTGSTTVSQYGLTKTVKVYDTDGATVLKKAEIDYNFDAAYISRRIIGLPSETRSYGVENGALVLASKATFAYDEENFSQETNQNISTVIQHDNTNYSA
ncbi:MAG: FG-GAP repeat domain-containing protein, partial [Pyrinomonadaceae bacterium]